MNKMNKKGFTLIEMLVVIAIIAVLVSIIVPTVSSSTDKAKAATDAANLRTIAAEAAIDYMDNDTLDQTYTAASKYLDGGSLEIYKNTNGDIEAVIKSGENFYGVDYFAFVAENGKTSVTEGSTTSTAPTYTAVAANKIYPAS